MLRSFHQLRLLTEILAIVALAEIAAMFLLPEISPGMEPVARALLDAALLVLLSGPLVLWRVSRAARGHPEERHVSAERRTVAILTVGVLVVGYSLSGLVAYESHEQAKIESRAGFERLVDRLALESERRIEQNLMGLRAVRGIFAASRSVERGEFRAFVATRELSSEFPGALGFGVVKRVPRGELESFVAAERRDEAPEFAVRTKGEAPDLYVLSLLEPDTRSLPLAGWDLGAEPECRAALESAVASGQPTLSGRIRPSAEGARQALVLYVLPIYRNGTHPDTPEERAAALDCLACVPIVVDEALHCVAEQAGNRLELEIFDGRELVQSSRLWHAAQAVDERAPGAVQPSAFRERREIQVGGRTWTIAAASTPEFEAQVASLGPALLGIGGGILTTLLAMVVWSIGLARVRTLHMAREMTSDLAAAKTRAEGALRDVEALRQTLDQHSIVSVTDPFGVIVEVNEAFARSSGYTREELLGRRHSLLSSGVHPRAYWTEVWRTLTQGRAWRGEICNRAKDGSLYWHDTVIAPFCGADGSIERYISIRSDITLRKKAELEQAEALQLTSALARSSDATQAARAVNDALGRTTGLERSAVLLFGDDRVCRFVGWRGLSYEYRRTVDGHCPWSQGQSDAQPIVVDDVSEAADLASYRELFRDEGIASLAFIPVQAESGVLGKLMLYASEPRGITPAHVRAAAMAAASLGSAVARLRTADALAKSERRFRSLVEDCDVVVWEFDPRRDCFTYVSPQAVRLGYALEQWLEPGFWDAHLHPQDLAWAREYGALELAAGRNHRYQYRMLAADGHVVWVDDFVTLDTTPEGERILRGVMVDITESKRGAAELLEARQRAEAATRAKSEFLANMSHEIRTPLTAILGYAEVLREDGEQAGDGGRRNQALDTICGAGRYLLAVINDVLDLSKIEAGRMTIEQVETPVVRLLAEVESLMHPRAIEKGVTLGVELQSPIPERALSDPTRMRQILMNLVGNAVKFTERGSIRIVARTESREAGERLVVDVEDTGPGLGSEEAARIFAAFSQADASVTRKHGGTGLGLTICRRLAELMGGTVTLAHSTPGVGACFRMDLPLVPVPGSTLISSLSVLNLPAEPRAPLPAPQLPGRILLAEDGRDNQRLISLHLRRAGAEVEIAANGRVALESIERAEQEGRPFGLLVSDMQMPEMDGYTLARTLRARGSRLAIVALTAHAMSEDRARCEDAGCDDYASKPIERLALLATCARWLGRPGGAAQELPRTGADSRRPG